MVQSLLQCLPCVWLLLSLMAALALESARHVSDHPSAFVARRLHRQAAAIPAAVSELAHPVEQAAAIQAAVSESAADPVEQAAAIQAAVSESAHPVEQAAAIRAALSGESEAVWLSQVPLSAPLSLPVVRHRPSD